MTTLIASSAETKHCRGCNRTLGRSEFHRHRSTRDGLQTRCKVCHVIANRTANEKDPTARREASRRDYGRNRGRLSKKTTPAQKRARSAVERALASGALVKPTTCSRCGRGDRRIYGHHEDYSRPLHVEWLCALCHGRHHRGLVTS